MYRAGIVGYGNLGQAVEKILVNSKEFSLKAIFSRRNVKSNFNTKVYNTSDLNDFRGKLDIIFLCVGSFLDIENFSKNILQNFNMVDSFDTHKKLKTYIKNLDEIGKLSRTTTLSAFGWDPGLLSLERLLFEAISNFPPHTFWGNGVSQGHSNAVRNLENVIDAVQYTIPIKEGLLKAKNEKNVMLKENEKHKRLVYVCCKKGSEEKVKKQIKEMPNYFEDYKTEVVFTDKKSIERRKKHLYHKGEVIQKFDILEEDFLMDFKLKLSSNPLFTASLMVVGARVCMRLKEDKNYGAFTIFDVPMKLLFKDLNKVYDRL